MRVERSAGGVVFRRMEGAPRVLVIRDPYELWGLPKGHLEGDESPGEAALREVREETGLEGVCLGPRIDTIDWFFRQEGELVHKFCTFFLMRSDLGEPEPERGEGITDCVWLEVEAAVDTVSYDNASDVVRRAGRMVSTASSWGRAFER